MTEFLVKHTGAIKRLYSERQAQDQERTSSNNHDEGTGVEPEEAGEQDIEAEDTSAEAGQNLTMAEFKEKLTSAFMEEKADREVWKGAVERIAAFGPRRVGPNVLVDMTQDMVCGKL